MFREYVQGGMIDGTQNPVLFILVQVVVSGAVAVAVTLACDYYFNKTRRK